MSRHQDFLQTVVMSLPTYLTTYSQHTFSLQSKSQAKHITTMRPSIHTVFIPILVLFLNTIHALPLINATVSPLGTNADLGLAGGLYSCSDTKFGGNCHW
jgi:hypothetical protein